MPRAQTLTEALAERGYAHRTARNGKREIYHLETGKVVGVMTWQEAWAWVRTSKTETGQC